MTPEFNLLSFNDILVGLAVNILAWTTLYISYKLRGNGSPVWIPRKLTHTVLGTTIAFSLPIFSSVFGALFALSLFLTILAVGMIIDEDFARKLLKIGTREGEHLIDTLFASITALLVAGIIYFLFYNKPQIYIASVLSLAWGDGSGELIGRAFGKHKIKFLWVSKSLEGSLSILIMSVIGMIVAYLVNGYEISIYMLSKFFLIGFFVSIVELLSYKWIDNLIIPAITATTLFILI
ncbi:MAG: hypothetical protein ABGF52_12390 [Candidatus Asgardarchaeum sp.]